ncbi:HlyIII-domain-containing protein, partial [Ramaria rubella]
MFMVLGSFGFSVTCADKTWLNASRSRQSRDVTSVTDHRNHMQLPQPHNYDLKFVFLLLANAMQNTDTLKQRRGRIEQPEPVRSSDQDRPRPVTISWQEIPAWMQDNEYILSGYRREQGSVMGCIHSIFGYVHNESVNIHSHLWGALLFVFFLCNIYSHLDKYPSVNLYDVGGLVIFLVSAVMCLTFSASYHTMTCHSKVVHDWCHCFDYTGIVVLIVGSFFPCIYYTFYCTPRFQVIYLAAISIAGCGASYIVLSPTYSRPAYRSARTIVFVALGLFAVLPVSHALYVFGYHKLSQDLGFHWLIASGALYLSGALIYAKRFPEKWFVQSPNRFFDHWFSSHQIFHLHVILAVLSHYIGVLQAMHHWHSALGGVCLSS